jgi:hypothetical protein
MGNNSYLPVLGQGLVVISLNGQRILVWNVLHVQGLVVPLLYSLRAHFTQPGCGFIGANGIGIHVYFPTFVLLVDTSKDCHLAYKPLGRSTPLKTLHYVQPCCREREFSSHLAAKSLAIVKDDFRWHDDSDALIWSYPQPKCISPTRPLSPMLVAATPSTGSPSAGLESVSTQLCSLADSVSSLMTPVSSASLIGEATSCGSHSSPGWSLQCHVMRLFCYCIMTSPPFLLFALATRPKEGRTCDTANASDTKTHWSAKELHRIMGCCKFQKYNNILQVSLGGE